MTPGGGSDETRGSGEAGAARGADGAGAAHGADGAGAARGAGGTGAPPTGTPHAVDGTGTARLAGAAGVLGFVLATFGSVGMGVFGAASLFEFPGTRSSAAEVASFVATHRSAALAAMVLNTLAIALWLVFGAGVWLRLREGGESILSAAFALGFASFATLIFAGFLPFFVLAYRGGDPDDARLLYDLTFGMLALSGAPTAVALGSYAAHVWRTQRLPRWTAMLAAIGAVAHVVLLASFLVKDGFFSLEGQVITAIPATLFIWVLGTGVAMLAGSRRGERPAERQ